MKYKEIYEIAAPGAKRQNERFNFWVSMVVRPLSILFTIPLIKTKVKPITITAISLFMSLVGFSFVAFGKDMLWMIVGWFFFFAWAILDGVDGNLARYTNQCSQLGELWDATGGYATMVLMYYAAGIAGFFSECRYMPVAKYWVLILGGATAIFSIFPRLIMQKKKSCGIGTAAVKELSDKNSFSLTKILALNLISSSGFMQIIFLVCIIFKVLNWFIFFYFFVHLGVMVLSLYKLLRN